MTRLKSKPKPKRAKEIVYGDIVQPEPESDKQNKALDELVSESERLGLYDWQQGTEQEDDTKT